MFNPNNSIQLLDPLERKVHALHTCINQPTVSLEGAPAAPTFAFICGVWTKDKKAIEAFIMLFQPKNNLAVFYQHETGPVNEDDYWQVENDALNFTDSMGFMMDNLFYSELSDVQQHEVLFNFPPFMANRKLYQATQPISVATPKEPEKTNVELPEPTKLEDPEAPEVALEPEASQPKLVELDADAEVVLVEEPENDEIPDTMFAGLELESDKGNKEKDDLFTDNLEFFERPIEAIPAPIPASPAPKPAAPVTNDAAIKPEYVKLLTAF